MADGAHTIVASETNSGGTGSASLTFTLDTVAPVVTEALVSDTGSSPSDKISSDDAVTGGGDPNAVVTLVVDGGTPVTTTANGSGTWSYTPASLPQGSNTIVASETDLAGNTGSTSLTFTLDTVAPVVTEAPFGDTGSSPSDKITSDDAVTGGGDPNMDTITNFNTLKDIIDLTGIGPTALSFQTTQLVGNKVAKDTIAWQQSGKNTHRLCEYLGRHRIRWRHGHGDQTQRQPDVDSKQLSAPLMPLVALADASCRKRRRAGRRVRCRCRNAVITRPPGSLIAWRIRSARPPRLARLWRRPMVS